MQTSESATDGWLTVEGAAAYLKLSPTTIYRAVKRQEIPHYRLGRAVRFRTADLDRWAETFRVPAREPH